MLMRKGFTMAQLKREDWLERGLLLLAEKGIDALTINEMCQQFDVTKGSFYHHFKNRQAFLEAVLTYWEDRFTQQFIEFSQEGLNAQEKMARLHQMVIENYGTYEVNIRAWAQVDPLAQAFQERVDQTRLNFLYELQREFYQTDEEARTMAQLQYTTLIGSSQLMPELSAQDLNNMYHLLTRLSLTLQRQDE